MTKEKKGFETEHELDEYMRTKEVEEFGWFTRLREYFIELFKNVI